LRLLGKRSFWRFREQLNYALKLENLPNTVNTIIPMELLRGKDIEVGCSLYSRKSGCAERGSLMPML
jgi:hypothetical protein